MGILLADSCWADILVLLATICGLIYYWSISTYNYWQSRGVKTVPGITPFFGSLKDSVLLKKQMGVHYTEMYWSLDGERYGGYYKIRKPALMIRDPALVKDVMTKDFAHFLDNDVHISEKTDPMLAYNMFNMKGATWKYVRSKFSPIFATGKIRGMFPLMLEVCEELKEHIQRKIDSDNPEFKAKDVASNYATDVVASCAFGFKANSLRDENNKFRKMGREIMTPAPARALIGMAIFLYPPLTAFVGFFGIKFITDHIVNFFRNLVSEAFEFREKNNFSRNDLIQLLMQVKKLGKVEEEGEEVKKSNNDVAHSEEGKIEFTHDVLTAQAVGFFFDGYETSSAALSYAMHELTMNPDIQTKLREDLRKLVDENEGVLTYDSVRDCPYLDQIFYETLRKHPAVGFLGKVCTKRYQIPGSDLHIEVGTSISLPVLGLHTNPKYYPEPEKFIPERFSDENKKKRVPGTFLGFGDGPRQCVGSRFAHAQVKTALATVVLNFELLPTENTKDPVDLEVHFFMNTPVGGLPMKAVPLNY